MLSAYFFKHFFRGTANIFARNLDWTREELVAKLIQYNLNDLVE
jgi:hypothetical protein